MEQDQHHQESMECPMFGGIFVRIGYPKGSWGFCLGNLLVFNQTTYILEIETAFLAFDLLFLTLLSCCEKGVHRKIYTEHQ